MILNPFSSVEQDYSRTIKTKRTLSKKHFSGESESASCAIRRRERGRDEASV